MGAGGTRAAGIFGIPLVAIMTAEAQALVGWRWTTGFSDGGEATALDFGSPAVTVVSGGLLVDIELSLTCDDVIALLATLDGPVLDSDTLGSDLFASASLFAHAACAYDVREKRVRAETVAS